MDSPQAEMRRAGTAASEEVDVGRETRNPILDMLLETQLGVTVTQLS